LHFHITAEDDLLSALQAHIVCFLSADDHIVFHFYVVGSMDASVVRRWYRYVSSTDLWLTAQFLFRSAGSGLAQTISSRLLPHLVTASVTSTCLKLHGDGLHVLSHVWKVFTLMFNKIQVSFSETGGLISGYSLVLAGSPQSR
jgi:hypothetical protein